MEENCHRSIVQCDVAYRFILWLLVILQSPCSVCWNLTCERRAEQISAAKASAWFCSKAVFWAFLGCGPVTLGEKAKPADTCFAECINLLSGVCFLGTGRALPGWCLLGSVLGRGPGLGSELCLPSRAARQHSQSLAWCPALMYYTGLGMLIFSLVILSLWEKL